MTISLGTADSAFRGLRTLSYDCLWRVPTPRPGTLHIGWRGLIFDCRKRRARERQADVSGGAGEDNCIKCSQKRTASSCHALPPLMTHSRNGPQVHHLMPARRLRGRLGCGFQVCASNPGLRCALSPPSFAVSLDAVPKGERLRISFRSFAPRAAATQPRQHFRPHFGGQAARAPGLNVPGDSLAGPPTRHPSLCAFLREALKRKDNLRVP